MLTSKIKNLMIYILLFVNLFLIALLASDQLQALASRRTASEAVETILADSGIRLQCRMPDNDRVKRYTLSRDPEREEELAASVLGGLSVRERQDGNIMYYRGERGEGKFRGTGYFEILLDNWSVPIRGGTVETAQSVMRRMGLKGEFAPELSTQTAGVYTTVVMVCQCEGVPVVDARLEFGFTSDFLMMVSGTRVLDTRREDSSFRPLDATTMITRFLGLVSRNGYVCSELRKIEPVYLAPNVSGGTVTPLWRIETDAGTFYLDMTTGEERTVT